MHHEYLAFLDVLLLRVRALYFAGKQTNSLLDCLFPTHSSEKPLSNILSAMYIIEMISGIVPVCIATFQQLPASKF